MFVTALVCLIVLHSWAFMYMFVLMRYVLIKDDDVCLCGCVMQIWDVSSLLC